MALEIRMAPVLYGKAARDFLKKEKEARAARGTVDFSEQARIGREILKKAKLNKA